MGRPRIVAVMPIKGREELFPITIKRLHQQEDVQMKVVVICDTENEKKIARLNGANFATDVVTQTLGQKWHLGVTIAKEYEPDAIMIVGSGNWFTNGWCSTLYPCSVVPNTPCSMAMTWWALRRCMSTT